MRKATHVYLTKAEIKRVKIAADKLGISVSAYIKVKLFQDEKN